MGFLKTLGVGLVAAVVGVGTYDLITFNRAAWQSDYANIKRGMARHYGNLDWVRDERGLDLAALDLRTSERLDGAYSHVQAYLALSDFAAAFGDPHVKLAYGRDAASTASNSAVDEPADPPAGADCAAAGYGEEDKAFAPHFGDVPGWKSLGEGAFPSAIAGGTGFVRIASFSEQNYAAACARAFKPGMGQRALQLATRAELQADLTTAIAGLKSAGAKAIVIDLTGNGGGSEWEIEAASLFTAKAMRRTEPRLADAPCDRTAIWSGARVRCAVFASKAEVTTLQGAGNWTGPAWVLTDGGTASAAEGFLGWLKDNGVARQAGTRTMGAGCGYIDGGKPVVLAAAPLTLRFPNCARFTAAGRNEIDGWAPDAPLAAPDKGGEAAWGARLLAITGG